MESLETGDFGTPYSPVRFTSTGRFDGVGYALDEPHYLVASLPLHSLALSLCGPGVLSTRSVSRLSSGRSSQTDCTPPNHFGQGGSVCNECRRVIRPGASGVEWPWSPSEVVDQRPHEDVSPRRRGFLWPLPVGLLPTRLAPEATHALPDPAVLDGLVVAQEAGERVEDAAGARRTVIVSRSRGTRRWPR